MTRSEWFHRNFPLIADGNPPFLWQSALYERLLGGNWPAQIDLPTGTGKTSFMTVWLLALAWRANEGGGLIPRRLVWVVNRRVVVDQATEEAKKLLKALEQPELSEVRAALESSSASGTALAVSTLRGEKEDNGLWKDDPSAAAIVVGTVDMIGSRLLFSGYGDSAYWRPLHAGLLAVDTVLVNDEAHLTPPFVKLLREIARRKPGERVGKQFRFVEMSATHAGEKEEGLRNRFPETLEGDCEASKVFADRFTTPKKLFLDLQPDNKKMEARILELAAAPGAARTIMYVEQPEKARDLCVKLSQQFPKRVWLLTGTMRGQERDDLKWDDFAADPPPERAFLVSTSAGEVGIDITAERMISELAEANHLIQRFGRLDRYGKGGGEAHIVYTAANLKEKPKEETLSYLESLQPEFSSRLLRERPAPAGASDEPVKTAELHDWLLELWCQTSDPVGAYPPVEPWLHGKQIEYAETELAWREDVTILAREEVSDADRKQALQTFPVLARERLREPTSRIRKKLASITEHSAADTRVLVQAKDGEVSSFLLADLADEAKVDLDYAIVLLPLGVGGLESGMLSDAKGAGAPTDKADGLDRRERWRQRIYGEGKPDRPNMKAKFRVDVQGDDDEIIPTVAYWEEETELAKKYGKVYLLEKHLEAVGEKAGLLAEKLFPELAPLFVDAALRHDVGKRSDLWQRSMGRCEGKVVAKSFSPPNGKGLAGYRHELGSVVEAPGGNALLLHLIAAHHGHARPHFRRSAADAEKLKDSWDAIDEAPGRFSKLTDEFGPWGLAYLEAILKAADSWASEEAPEDNV